MNSDLSTILISNVDVYLQSSLNYIELSTASEVLMTTAHAVEAVTHIGSY